MHTDFFDRCESAIQNGFYFEAIIMEYAAIESRLEVICGVLGFPCGKDCKCRKDIMIGSRIDCLRKYRCDNECVYRDILAVSLCKYSRDLLPVGHSLKESRCVER